MMAPGGAAELLHILVKAEVSHDALGGRLRLAGRDTDVPALLLEGAHQTADAWENPVLEQAFYIISLAVGLDRLVRRGVVHAHILAEGIPQRRANELAQRGRIGLREAQLVRGILHAVPDALLGPGQGTVQIENYSFTHKSVSPSTPKRS